MKRIIQGLALAALASTVQAAPGDAFPAGAPPAVVIAKQTHASINLSEGDKQLTGGYPFGSPPNWLIAKETHADRHANDAKTQTGYAFPGHASGTGD